ncbi:MAG: fructosamine kinase family protein [Myxococcota bacterium]|nr:fructosamine kinase family protein [Myxococcota bacterium]
MDPDLRERIEALLPEPIEKARELGGGSIGTSWRVDLVSGQSYFIKHYVEGPAGLVSAEEAGLAWLAEAGALPTARTVASLDEDAILILEWIEGAKARSDAAERLGRGLAQLHAFSAPEFGFSEDNFIGSLPQANAACEHWADFYAYRRIEPLVRRGQDAGHIPAGLAGEASRMLARFEALCGPSEPPARLHGDLWSGNAMLGPEGEFVLIDPAVYGGHREVDLAMMQLFGGFPDRSFDAYSNEFPLAAEAEERVAFYQLYPLLVHVNLFGESYVDSFARALRTYR